MEDKTRETTVGGEPTGDITKSGNPDHNSDGTFAPKDGASSIPEVSDRLKTKLLNRIKMKASSLFIGARESYDKIKDKIVTLKNFDFARKRNKEHHRDLNYKISEENKKILGDKIKEIFENNELGMRIKFTNLIKAINQNKLKNLHEAGTGGGCTNSEYRGEFSVSVFGSPTTTSRVQRYDFEKYGCLVSRGVKDSIERSDVADHYGNCCITFKKNNLKGRTTYTLDDSLSNDYVVPGIVGDTFDPNCFVSSYNCEKVNRKIEQIKNTKTVRDFNNSLDISYTELQYHGDLTFDDVSSIRVPDIYIKSDELKNVMKTTLLEKNIPVYTYDFVNNKEYKLEINEIGEIIKTEVKL